VEKFILLESLLSIDNTPSFDWLTGLAVLSYVHL
jgi:hypothetical protein